MKAIKVLAVTVALMAVAAGAASAAEGDKPLFDWSRLSLGAGLNYAWHVAPFSDSAPVPPFGKEWEAGLYGAYNLTPLLSIAGSSVYGLDNKLVENRLGLRIRLGNGGN